MSSRQYHYRTPVEVQTYGGERLPSDYDTPETTWETAFRDRAAFPKTTPVERNEADQLNDSESTRVVCRWHRGWSKLQADGRKVRLRLPTGEVYVVRSISDANQMHRHAELACDRASREAGTC